MKNRWLRVTTREKGGDGSAFLLAQVEAAQQSGARGSAENPLLDCFHCFAGHGILTYVHQKIRLDKNLVI